MCSNQCEEDLKITKEYLDSVISNVKRDTLAAIDEFYSRRLTSDFYDKRAIDEKFLAREPIITSLILKIFNSQNRTVNDPKFVELNNKLDALSELQENFDAKLKVHSESLDEKYLNLYDLVKNTESRLINSDKRLEKIINIIFDKITDIEIHVYNNKK